MKFNYMENHPGLIKLDFDKLIIKVDSKEKLNGLKNFLRYRTINDFGLSTKPNSKFLTFDYDKLDAVEKDLEKYMEKLGIDNIDYKKYETDTVNSVQTLLGFYMRGKYSNKYTNYKYENYNYKNYNLLCLLENDQELINDPVIKKFDELCLIYHTLGNIVFVPKKFNTERASMLDNIVTNDFYDIALVYLKNNNYIFKGNKYYNGLEKTFKLISGYDYFKNIHDKLFDDFKLAERRKNKYQELIDSGISDKKIDKAIINTLNNMIDSINKRNNDIERLMEK